MKLKHFVNWLKEETLRVVPAILFFCISFNLIYFTIGLGLRPDDTRYLSYFTVTVTALIMGKVLIIVNAFPFIDAFPQKPLIYNIVWKFCIFSLTIFLLEALHSYWRLWLKLDNAALAWQHLGKEVSSPVFWSIALWLFLVFGVYITFSELARVIGMDRMKKILF